jgi:hypothetical protein
MKTIITTVTLMHDHDEHGRLIPRLPGTPVTIDDDAEADRILARFGGGEVAAVAAEASASATRRRPSPRPSPRKRGEGAGRASRPAAHQLQRSRR